MPLPVSMDATWLNGSVQFNAQELRRADAALFGGDGSALGVRGGIVRHGDTSLAVTVNASDVVTVQPGAVVIPGNSGVGNGCYRSALGAAETGNLAARNATNPRIDLVVFRVLDTDVVGSHAAYTGRIEVIAGTPAASPAVPALPSLAVELARITVPASGGGTATVDSTYRQFTSSLGGELVVASFARLPASAPKWQRAVLLDTGLRYVYTGTAWQQDPVEDPWHVVGAAGEPGFLNNWVQSTAPGYQTDYGSVAFRKDRANNLHFRGHIAAGTVGSPMFQVPVGYRPSKNVDRIIWHTNNSGGVPIGLMRVDTNGNVVLYNLNGASPGPAGPYGWGIGGPHCTID